MQLVTYKYLAPTPSATNMLRLARVLVLGSLLTLTSMTQAQTSQRWFQIEVSIFTNESFTDRNEELWQVVANELNYPNPLRRLNQLSDLLISDEMIAELLDEAAPNELAIQEAPDELDEDALAAAERAARLAEVVATGPIPARAEGNFKFYDFLRDPYLQLTPSESDFQQTNRALERSSEHRLLFHGLWRESLADERDAVPIYVQGGQRVGEQHELQGTITLRFNSNRDRIVIDSDLWLTEYSASVDQTDEALLPVIPATVKTELDTLSANESSIEYGINRVFHMQQSREMRSTEFHYIDHPAMGIVVLVEPIEVPPLPDFDFDFEEVN